MSPHHVVHHGPMGARLALELAWLGIQMSPAPDAVTPQSFAAFKVAERKAGLPPPPCAPESSPAGGRTPRDPADLSHDVGGPGAPAGEPS